MIAYTAYVNIKHNPRYVVTLQMNKLTPNKATFFLSDMCSFGDSIKKLVV